MVRILITGSKGGLGQTLEERFRAPGLSLAPALPGPIEIATAARDQLDISRREQVEKVLREVKPDVVLNAVGKTNIDVCETYQWEAYLSNRDGTEHLARECARLGALLVYFSTDMVFDGGKRAPYTEEDPPNPLSVYADTKLAGELVTMKQAARRHLILRTGWLYGLPGRNFLRLVEDDLQENEILFGFDDQVGQPTYVHDFIDALQFLLSKGAQGTWHAASSGETTQFGALKKCIAALGKAGVEVRQVHRDFDARQAMRPKYSVLSCRKLEEAGFKMRPWESALAAYALKVASRVKR